jgi:hypothetical protein
MNKQPSLPKDGTLFTPDKKKKLDYTKNYTKVRVDFFTLTNWEGIQRSYKKDVDGSRILTITEFLEFIKKEKYE